MGAQKKNQFQVVEEVRRRNVFQARVGYHISRVLVKSYLKIAIFLYSKLGQ